jgi:hypothetical protein
MKHVTRLAALHSEMILGGGSARQPPFAAPVAGSVKTEVAAWCAIMGVYWIEIVCLACWTTNTESLRWQHFFPCVLNQKQFNVF